MVCSFTAAYHVLLLAMDRAVLLKAPAWHHNNASGRNIMLASCMVTAFGLLVSTSALLVFSKQNGECAFSELDDHIILSHALRSFNLLFILLGPCLILIICNILFVRELRSRDAKKQKNNNAATVSTKNFDTAISRIQQRLLQKRKNLQDYIKMIMIMTTAYLACTICIIIMVFLIANTAQNSALWLLYKSILSTFSILNASANFFFYLLSGNAYRSSFVRAFSSTYRKAGEPKPEAAAPRNVSTVTAVTTPF